MTFPCLINFFDFELINLYEIEPSISFNESKPRTFKTFCELYLIDADKLYFSL